MIATLHLTRNCSFACAYCYTGRKVADTMPEHILQRAIDRVMEIRGDTLAGFRFFGGEPLLRFDLIEQGVSYALQHPLRAGKAVGFAVSTNGAVLTTEHCDFLAQYRFELGISLDGPPRVHDRHRRDAKDRPTFDRVLTALRLAQDRVPATVVLMTICPDTVGSLSGSVRFLYEACRVRNLRANLNIHASWPPVAVETYARELEAVAVFHAEKMHAGDPVYIDRIDRNLQVFLKGGYACGFRCCSLGRTECAVAPSGYLYPCERLVGEDNREEWRIGHVDSGFDERRIAWMEQERHKGDPRCRQCSWMARCVYWCGCANIQQTGAWNQVSDVFCSLQQAELAVVERAARRLLDDPPPAFLDKYRSYLGKASGRLPVLHRIRKVFRKSP